MNNGKYKAKIIVANQYILAFASFAGCGLASLRAHIVLSLYFDSLEPSEDSSMWIVGKEGGRCISFSKIRCQF